VHGISSTVDARDVSGLRLIQDLGILDVKS